MIFKRLLKIPLMTVVFLIGGILGCIAGAHLSRYKYAEYYDRSIIYQSGKVNHKQVREWGIFSNHKSSGLLEYKENGRPVIIFKRSGSWGEPWGGLDNVKVEDRHITWVDHDRKYQLKILPLSTPEQNGGGNSAKLRSSP